MPGLFPFPECETGQRACQAGLSARRTGDQRCVTDETPEEGQLGRGTGRHGPWREDEDGARAAKQEGDPHALDVEGDPRGGVQSEDYRHADPREVVVDEAVPMMGPGGAPQEDKSVEERREESRALREAAMGPHPPEE